MKINENDKIEIQLDSEVEETNEDQSDNRESPRPATAEEIGPDGMSFFKQNNVPLSDVVRYPCNGNTSVVNQRNPTINPGLLSHYQDPESEDYINPFNWTNHYADDFFEKKIPKHTNPTTPKLLNNYHDLLTETLNNQNCMNVILTINNHDGSIITHRINGIINEN